MATFVHSYPGTETCYQLVLNGSSTGSVHVTACRPKLLPDSRQSAAGRYPTTLALYPMQAPRVKGFWAVVRASQRAQGRPQREEPVLGRRARDRHSWKLHGGLLGAFVASPPMSSLTVARDPRSIPLRLRPSERNRYSGQPTVSCPCIALNVARRNFYAGPLRQDLKPRSAATGARHSPRTLEPASR
jgi:hypothetical protein